MHCFALLILPEWLGELVHLQVLHLDGEWSEVISNRSLRKLPEALGSLHCLKSLTLKNSESLRTLPASIVTLTSLETLYIKDCWGFKELPTMGAMPALRSLTLCDSLQNLPACLGEFELRYLMLGYFRHVTNLPGICERLTVLETLHIEGCATLHQLQTMRLMTSLTSLTFHKCSITHLPAMRAMKNLTSIIITNCVDLIELPCVGQIPNLLNLSLVNLGSLLRLPVSIGKLTSLRNLKLDTCNMISDLPSMCEMWSLEAVYISNCVALKELPARVDALTGLHTLELVDLENLDTQPFPIFELTGLTELTLTNCGLKDVSVSIESLTNLRSLTISVPAAGLSTLACALPALRLLQGLQINELDEDDVITIGRSLKAWPMPLVVLYPFSIGQFVSIGQICCEALGLPAKAARWDNMVVLQHWRVQQHKMMAFVSGLHVRLGAASPISSLTDFAIVFITNEVLGGWTLRNLWQQERLAREALLLSM